MRFVSLLSAFCLLAAMPLFAGDGAIPIWEPTTITEPGSYILTRSIYSTESPIITIAVGEVTLDLNGFTIALVDGEPGDSAIAGGGASLEIRNGRVLGGIDLLGYGHFHGLHLVGGLNRCLYVEGGTSIVENNTIQGCSTGIWLDDAGATIIRNNVISGTTYFGIYVESGSGWLVIDNVVKHSASGIALSLDGGQVRRNSISNCSGDGIVGGTDSTIISGNVTTSLQGIGIHLYEGSTGNVLSGNLSRNNSGNGCTNPLGTADYCDEGEGNSLAGDNYMPDKM